MNTSIWNHINRPSHLSLHSGESTLKGSCVHSITFLLKSQTLRKLTYKVHCSEAPVADLPQVREELLGILPREELSHLRVLQAPGPHTRRHGQRLVSVEETHWVSICYLERIPTFVLKARVASETRSSLSHEVDTLRSLWWKLLTLMSLMPFKKYIVLNQRWKGKAVQSTNLGLHPCYFFSFFLFKEIQNFSYISCNHLNPVNAFSSSPTQIFSCIAEDCLVMYVRSLQNCSTISKDGPDQFLEDLEHLFNVSKMCGTLHWAEHCTHRLLRVANISSVSVLSSWGNVHTREQNVLLHCYSRALRYQFTVTQPTYILFLVITILQNCTG